jgi:hypothetical protein
MITLITHIGSINLQDQKQLADWFLGLQFATEDGGVCPSNTSANVKWATKCHQKIVLFIVSAARTSNPVKYIPCLRTEC